VVCDALLISCSNCGEAGHNKGTCSVKPTDKKALRIKSNSKLEKATDAEETELLLNTLVRM
jgi:hypothetical protein